MTLELLKISRMEQLVKNQCDQFWRNFGHVLKTRIVLGNSLNLFRQIIYAFGQIAVNGQILNI